MFRFGAVIGEPYHVSRQLYQLGGTRRGWGSILQELPGTQDAVFGARHVAHW